MFLYNELYKTGKGFLNEHRIFNNMEYKNNDRFESDSSALIVFITIIAVAISLLGIMVCIK